MGKHRRQMEKFEQEKEREVYNAKIDFFHQCSARDTFLLTLINGPLENILLKKSVDSETREDFEYNEAEHRTATKSDEPIVDFRKTESQVSD